MKHDNNTNSKNEHGATNTKHQKVVALRTQWLKDNHEKQKNDWNYRVHLKEMEASTVGFQEVKTNTLTRFVRKQSTKASSRAPVKSFEGKLNVEVDSLICHVCDVKTLFIENFISCDVKETAAINQCSACEGS